ncbi:MAG: oligosaccharide flippase family protein [Thermotogaceae bacterium]|nr:oligosaccharide flippase family protein [Thermotogaceae bacterium]
MSRARLFIENFLVYGMTGIIGKVIPVVMVPIITRLIPDTSIYGISDLLHVLVSFGSAFAVLGMYDAMFRMFFDDDTQEHKLVVCSSAFSVVAISSIITGAAVIIFSKSFSNLLFTTDEYYVWVVLMGNQIALGAFDSIISAPTRMQNKRKVYVVLSVVTPLTSYGISIPLIIFVDPLFGLIMGGFASVVSKLFIFWVLNGKWFRLRFANRKLALEMLKIGLPLMPTFLIYWIFNSFDRVMISNMLGTSQNGIYAVGAKVASISQLIYTGFAGGWQYFAFSTMKDKDQVQLTSRVYEYLGIISLVATILIMPWLPLLFQLLFTGDYVFGYQVAPYLFLSPLLLMLFQTSGNQLLVIKRSYWVTISLVIGAGLNVFLNYLLIPVLGIEGASVATLIGYSSSVVIMAVITTKLKLLKLQKRFVVSASITALFFVLSKLLLNKTLLPWLAVSLLSVGLILFLYREELQNLKGRMKRGRSE